MKRLKAFWVAFWPGPRAYWALGLLALLSAAAGAVPVLLVLAGVAAAAVLALVLADIVLLAGTQLGIAREVPDPFAMRRPGRIAYRLTNFSRLARRCAILEAPLALLQFDVDELQASVPAQSAVTVKRPVTPVLRGTGMLESLYVWYESPLGLLRRRLRVPAPQEVRVYPDLSAVERYGSLHVRNRLIEAGLRRMRLRGSGTEPESVREWGAGDSFRSIDWKATARHGKLMVAQYEVERSQNVMILLDAGRLMMPRVDLQRKFDFAVTAALSVAAIASLANDKVGVVAFAGEIIRAYAPRSNVGSLERIAREMHDLEPRFEESDYEAAFAYVRAHVHKRNLVLFFTDMLDPAAQSTVLAQLGTLTKRHVVVCAFMNDAAVDLALAGEPADVRAAYVQSVALELRAERKAAATTLARMGVRVIDVPAAQLDDGAH